MALIKARLTKLFNAVRNMNLTRVTFSESCSLKALGKNAFCPSGLLEIHIPDSIEELCEKCFCGCENPTRATFSLLH